MTVQHPEQFTAVRRHGHRQQFDREEEGQPRCVELQIRAEDTHVLVKVNRVGMGKGHTDFLRALGELSQD